MTTAHAAQISLWMVLPFAGLLLAIAVLPLTAPRLWSPNRNKLVLSLVLAFPVIFTVPPLVGFGPLGHALIEYFQFIVLLGSLYVISGGIVVTGDIEATPTNNAAFLAIGALLASVIGTTGASMLLIRPLLSTNSERHHVAHTVVFFIFMVSNTGGLLTPLGDPPLFLGYLRGVPFSWTAHLWPEWLGLNGALLVIYWLWDRRVHATETAVDRELDHVKIEPIRAGGLVNLVFLSGVILCVAFVPSVALAEHRYVPCREIGMLVLAGLSLYLPDTKPRELNQFSFEAIEEVAALFIGIFITMVPALLILEARGAGLGVDSPARFFWCAGALSSFLDNAPTYATFFELGRSVTAAGSLTPAVAGVWEPFLKAISLGAVAMGANTYIGNGPNFMVKSIAESRGVKMPSFFGYMVYSGCILLPLFGLTTLLVFR